MSQEQTALRLEKLEVLKSQGISVYPERFQTNYELYEASSLEDGTSGVRVAGRIMGIRQFSKFSFISISDIQGKLQLLLKKNEVGEEAMSDFLNYFDIGDFIGVEGNMYSTKTNEKTLRIENYVLLGKALHPLPDKWHGLTNTDTRYRQRYIDLMMTKETQNRMLMRTKVVRAVRRFLEEKRLFGGGNTCITTYFLWCFSTPV
ncbi:OB-fold nucleic acid binding domain-containing protein [Bacillus sp. LL01]|uniref:OB-fold nucleic acid binding domain-containing protein n=1 Tax=Bacillus sp. LL01 TaxID=1665556 RepID=UPI000ADC6B9B|nr:OB-fold nucleic acid binding domain-containing protein [Bacillus sp. LL01]